MSENYTVRRELENFEPPVIDLEKVTKDYKKGTHALKDVSISIQKGEFVFIVGTSGSGKSTLIKLMLREIMPTSGKIYVAGRDLSRLHSWNSYKHRRNIGIVFQDFRLLPDRTVYENVAFAMRVVETPNNIIKREVPRILGVVDLSSRRNAYPSELSGGEQQRVALARALVNNPVILLADEPTADLDPKNSKEIMNLLEAANRRGTTVVVVTHNAEIVDSMQKRVITLNNGVVVSDNKKGGYSYTRPGGQKEDDIFADLGSHKDSWF